MDREVEACKRCKREAPLLCELVIEGEVAEEVGAFRRGKPEGSLLPEQVIEGRRGRQVKKGQVLERQELGERCLFCPRG